MKKFILLLLILAPVFVMNAQDNTQETKKKAAIKTTFLANKLHDNWFITLQGGVADLMSEESRYVSFGDRIKPTVGLSVGKWMSPVWGLRLNVTGAELQGFSTWSYVEGTVDHGLGSWYLGKNHPYGAYAATNSYLSVYDNPAHAKFVRERFLEDPRTTDEGSGFDYSMKYVGASVDFLWNLNNTFRPYNEKRFFDIILSAGVAYTHTFKEASPVDGYDRTAVNLVGIKTGIQPTFRLSDAWNLNLEAQYYILPEVFDRRVGDGNTMDGLGNYMLGFTYKFNKRNFEEPMLMDQGLIDDLIRQINELRAVPAPVQKDNCCDELRARLQRIEDMLNKPEKVKEKERLKIVVYFVIDKHDVRPQEMYKLDEIAAFMSKHPEVKVSVSGYADVKTAYPEYNMKLSERRSNEVIRILTTKYKIDRSRFSSKSFGDTVQPFDINELNRAVIAFDIE
jgi:outer membrane protein OmpA-like peptidoglycan-associated protein